eukprot:5351878-Alexandrium_andersonii.AAC.1
MCIRDSSQVSPKLPETIRSLPEAPRNSTAAPRNSPKLPETSFTKNDEGGPSPRNSPKLLGHLPETP